MDRVIGEGLRREGQEPTRSQLPVDPGEDGREITDIDQHVGSRCEIVSTPATGSERGIQRRHAEIRVELAFPGVLDHGGREVDAVDSPGAVRERPRPSNLCRNPDRARGRSSAQGRPGPGLRSATPVHDSRDRRRDAVRSGARIGRRAPARKQRPWRFGVNPDRRERWSFGPEREPPGSSAATRAQAATVAAGRSPQTSLASASAAQPGAQSGTRSITCSRRSAAATGVSFGRESSRPKRSGGRRGAFVRWGTHGVLLRRCTAGIAVSTPRIKPWDARPGSRPQARLNRDVR